MLDAFFSGCLSLLPWDLLHSNRADGLWGSARQVGRARDRVILTYSQRAPGDQDDALGAAQASSCGPDSVAMARWVSRQQEPGRSGPPLFVVVAAKACVSGFERSKAAEIPMWW